jgi:hypothetical protein
MVQIAAQPVFPSRKARLVDLRRWVQTQAVRAALSWLPEHRTEGWWERLVYLAQPVFQSLAAQLPVLRAE